MKQKIYILFGLAAVLSLVLASTAQAGTLTNASTTPVTSYGGRVGNYSVSFTVASSTEVESRIRLIFPSGFNVSAATPTSTISASLTLAAGTVASATVSGQEITLWLADGAVAVLNDTLHFSGIGPIQSPYAGGSFTLGVETRTLANDLSDDASSTAFSILAGYTGGTSLYGDSLPPTSVITSPTDGSTIPAGTKYVIKGTAMDSGGSVVQTVEVSLDNGQSWSMAEITSALANVFSWEYNWQNPTAGAYVVKVRATDAVGNVESPSAGSTVTVAVPASVSPAPVTQTPTAPTTVSELQAKIAEVQQKIVDLLTQLIQVLRAEIQRLM